MAAASCARASAPFPDAPAPGRAHRRRCGWASRPMMPSCDAARMCSTSSCSKRLGARAVVDAIAQAARWRAGRRSRRPASAATTPSPGRARCVRCGRTRCRAGRASEPSAREIQKPTVRRSQCRAARRTARCRRRARGRHRASDETETAARWRAARSAAQCTSQQRQGCTTRCSRSVSRRRASSGNLPSTGQPSRRIPPLGRAARFPKTRVRMPIELPQRFEIAASEREAEIGHAHHHRQLAR